MTGKELQKTREALNYTRQEFADKLKITYTTVYRWERGLRSIPPYLELAIQSLKL